MPTSTIEVIMPQMGEAITEATISLWRKAEGDVVEEGEPLLDISTAKVEVELPAPESGILARRLFKEGDTVPIDTVIALLAPKGADISKIEAPAPNGPSKATIHEPVAASESVSAPTPTPIANRNHSAQDAREIAREREHLIKRRSSPLVRKMSQELGIDLDQVDGTGLHGRVTRKDLENHLAEQKALADAKHLLPQQPPLRPAKGRNGAMKMDTVAGPVPEATLLPPMEVTVPMMRRMIADQMVKSVQNIPQAFTIHEVDFTQLEKQRVRSKTLFEAQYGARLTPLVFLVRAVTDALLKCPYINASWGGDRIILHRNVNIGIAVAIRDGLVVPVLKGVETMSLAGIARGIADLAQRARENRLKPSDMEHATFTITSPGQLGATIGIPIVNRPQGGILHLGAIHKIPAVVTGADGEDTIAIRVRAMLTLGIDHRLIDGWEADKFMIHVKQRIQRAEFGLPG